MQGGGPVSGRCSAPLQRRGPDALVLGHAKLR